MLPEKLRYYTIPYSDLRAEFAKMKTNTNQISTEHSSSDKFPRVLSINDQFNDKLKAISLVQEPLKEQQDDLGSKWSDLNRKSHFAVAQHFRQGHRGQRRKTVAQSIEALRKARDRQKVQLAKEKNKQHRSRQKTGVVQLIRKLKIDGDSEDYHILRRKGKIDGELPKFCDKCMWWVDDRDGCPLHNHAVAYVDTPQHFHKALYAISLKPMMAGTDMVFSPRSYAKEPMSLPDAKYASRKTFEKWAVKHYGPAWVTSDEFTNVFLNTVSWLTKTGTSTLMEFDSDPDISLQAHLAKDAPDGSASPIPAQVSTGKVVQPPLEASINTVPELSSIPSKVDKKFNVPTRNNMSIGTRTYPVPDFLKDSFAMRYTDFNHALQDPQNVSYSWKQEYYNLSNIHEEDIDSGVVAFDDLMKKNPRLGDCLGGVPILPYDNPWGDYDVHVETYTMLKQEDDNRPATASHLPIKDRNIVLQKVTRIYNHYQSKYLFILLELINCIMTLYCWLAHIPIVMWALCVTMWLIEFMAFCWRTELMSIIWIFLDTIARNKCTPLPYFIRKRLFCTKIITYYNCPALLSTVIFETYKQNFDTAVSNASAVCRRACVFGMPSELFVSCLVAIELAYEDFNRQIEVTNPGVTDFRVPPCRLGVARQFGLEH